MLMQKITAFFTALITLFTLWFCPAKPEEGVFGETSSTPKVKFDEGVFEMKEYDLVVSPEGSDANEGTESSPLATLEGAKNKLKSLKNNLPENTTVTVWFKEGKFIHD